MNSQMPGYSKTNFTSIIYTKFTALLSMKKKLYMSIVSDISEHLFDLANRNC